jgi:hypothetical protein
MSSPDTYTFVLPRKPGAVLIGTPEHSNQDTPGVENKKGDCSFRTVRGFGRTPAWKKSGTGSSITHLGKSA